MQILYLCVGERVHDGCGVGVVGWVWSQQCVKTYCLKGSGLTVDEPLKFFILCGEY